MKTYRIWGYIIIRPENEEERKKLENVDGLVRGTHHIHRNQKGGPRKPKGEVRPELLEDARIFGEKLASIARPGAEAEKEASHER